MRLFSKCIICLLIFLIGYTLGVIGPENIINLLVIELKGLNLISTISFISSISTLILFIAYIFGRLYMIKKVQFTLPVNIDLSYQGEIEGLKVVNEYDLGANNSETIYLYSSEPLRWIKIYEYDYENSENGTLVIQHDLLKDGYAIKINTYLPCGVPNYILEYQRFDYIQGQMLIGENGKNGVLEEHLSTKYTLRSYFYYLVK
ncbi:hypothetical protein ACE3MQ_22495 [Paenibacillus lentus]|uniref:hypothetical protein n=1 Tax=Paenibacillus lentus TaxID=1338368 RepID=UPI00365042C3